MYRSPTSHFAQTRHHQTSVYASARFLFETGERNGAPISSRRSCGRRSCSTALSPRSYARPLNINKRRHGVLDSPLCRSANKACALLIGPGPAVNPIDLHTEHCEASLAARPIFSLQFGALSPSLLPFSSTAPFLPAPIPTGVGRPCCVL